MAVGQTKMSDAIACAKLILTKLFCHNLSIC